MKYIVKTTVSLTLLALLVTAVVTLLPDTSEAIPAFARKYRMSCTTCHAPMPRLKAYGDEFAGNGFVLKDQDAPRWFVDAGDEDLSLIRDFPFAVRLEGFLTHHTATDRELDFGTPYNVKLLSGGSFAPNVAYYFYFYMSERGEVAGIEDAYIMFNNVINDELDIYIGQFQVSDPLFKREVRLTFEDYQVYRAEVGESAADLTYDRGIMLTYGFESGTDVVLEIINGNGLVEADESRVFDNDKYKNIAGRVSQDLGDYLRLGGFGYYGKEASSGIKNELYYFGADATIGYEEKFALNLQVLRRVDDNPMFTATAPTDDITTDGIMAEAIVMPDGETGKWYAVGLWNYVDSDIDEVITGEAPMTYNTITGHIGYLLRTNLRLFFENTYDIEFEENRAVVGLISAF